MLVYASRLQTFQRVDHRLACAFDLMLGGGWPLNCWNEIIGLESHGKTVMALKTLAANMADDPDYMALWVASEDFNKEWAGRSASTSTVSSWPSPTSWRTPTRSSSRRLDSQAFDAIVLDSYPALQPTAEAEAAIDEWQVGIGARLTNKLMRVSHHRRSAASPASATACA